MIYDVAIIGAGPCGLAVASRLRESTPSALFTDAEHARYWKRFNRRHESVESQRKMKSRKPDPPLTTDSSSDSSPPSPSSSSSPLPPPLPPPPPSTSRTITILDAHSNSWLSMWRARFRTLHIDHLRSPLFFHPDPRDRDGLLAFSHATGRMAEVEEVANVVGREISKHRVKMARDRRGEKKIKKVSRHLRVDDRDRIDYFTPSTSLFDDYCDDIVDRYCLSDLVQHARVENITYGDIGGLVDGDVFSLHTADGLVVLAKTVVLAVGPGGKPCIPLDHQLRLGSVGDGGETGSVCHCLAALGESCLPAHVAEKIRLRQHTEVVVVGGGLTSAQISDQLIRRGVDKVWLLMRGKYKLKHFDVDLEWVSKVRNQQMAVFWSAETDQERFELLKQARNGGSITPRFDKILQKHICHKRLAILQYTQINTGSWNSVKQTWSLSLSPHTSDGPGEIDHIIYATGNAPNIENVACLQQIQEEHPVEVMNGLARITDDLMWNETVPLFLTGGLAGLRLGPGAANLAGARQGAERIAWKIDQLLGDATHAQDRGVNTVGRSGGKVGANGRRQSEEEERSEFTGGFVNQFEALGVCED